jgi:Uma2 family endonuclease
VATSVQIPLSEYLSTAYRPDCEYVDGELVERNVGKYEHARLQALLAAWFIQNQKSWRLVALTEQRVQVSSSRVRIPDLCIVPFGPHPDVLAQPPLLVIEILSPDDHQVEVQRRSHDYIAMGVSNIWVIDPSNRMALWHSAEAWHETTSRLRVPDSPVYVDIEALFRDLDESRA